MSKKLRRGIMRCTLVIALAVGISTQVIASVGEELTVANEVLEKQSLNASQELEEQAEDTFPLKINVECEVGEFRPSYIAVFKSDAKSGDKAVWSSRNDFEVDLPRDTYVVQIVGKDDANNQYCLYAATDNGSIEIERRDLAKIALCLNSGGHSITSKSVTVQSVDFYFPSISGVSFNSQQSNDINIYVLKNEKTLIKMRFTTEGYSYILGKEINTQQDGTLNLGVELKKVQTNDDLGSFKVGHTGFKQLRNVAIEDEYGNKLYYVYSKDGIGEFNIQGHGYDLDQELIWNGGTKFDVPSYNGSYTVKADFRDDLPIPVPDIEGTITVTGGVDEPGEVIDEVKVKQFISRLYDTCLGRESDEGGLEYWAQLLKSGNVDGAGLASFFVNSDEFQNKDLSSEEYIKTMYTAFFDRQADEDGLTFWKSNLDQGLTKNYVLAGFVNSQEYQQICDTYGIVRGSVELNSVIDQNPNITKFIYRMYTKCMNRIPDEGGLNYWVQGLVDGEFTGKSTAEFFVNSSEFENKNLSNGEYVEVMYEVFFGRASDEGGRAYWLEVLAKGDSRETVFNGFVYSKEYQQICNDYGIKF